MRSRLSNGKSQVEARYVQTAEREILRQKHLIDLLRSQGLPVSAAEKRLKEQERVLFQLRNHAEVMRSLMDKPPGVR
jgi:hypothetical protein